MDYSKLQSELSALCAAHNCRALVAVVVDEDGEPFTFIELDEDTSPHEAVKRALAQLAAVVQAT